jgi:hypothetical protein
LEAEAAVWAARLVTLLHAVIIVFVFVGAFWARGRFWPTVVHLGFLTNGVAIGIWQWTCPLTHVERWLLDRAGVPDHDADPVTRLLAFLVYPPLPEWLLVCCGLAAALLSAYVYLLHDRVTAVPRGAAAA